MDSAFAGMTEQKDRRFMPDTFKFELVSPEKLLVSAEVEQVLVPGSEGEMTILAHHAPVLTTLKPGLLDIAYPGSGKRQRFFIRGGFAEVNPAGLTVLAETAIDLAELDAATLAQAIRDAEEDVADLADAARDRAQTRLDHLRQVQATLHL
jgi:F-type H+-transporting ATPase subunit epsilon